MNIRFQIEQNEKDWRVWYESEKPEAEEIPCSYSSTLDGFRKLLLIRSWSPDRTISQAKRYVEESLGSQYGEMQILDLEATWVESEPRTPLVCILSIGSDPTSQIGSLAKNKCIGRGHNQRFRQVPYHKIKVYFFCSIKIRVNGSGSGVSCTKNDY